MPRSTTTHPIRFSVLPQLWERTVKRHPYHPCMHSREALREVKQVDTGGGGGSDLSKGPRRSQREHTTDRLVLSPHFNTATYLEVDLRVHAVGAGLHHLLESECGQLSARGAAASSQQGRDGREDLRHVGLYAETRAEWMVAALVRG